MNGLFAGLAIARNTLREVLCAPVFLLSLFLALMLAGVAPALSCFAFDEEMRLSRDSMLSLAWMCGAAASVLAAGLTVGNEHRRRTVSLILTKPVSPLSYVLGKYFGLAAALAVWLGVFYAAGSAALIFGVSVDAAHENNADEVGGMSRAELTAALGLLLPAFAGLAGAVANRWRGWNFSLWALRTLAAAALIGGVALAWKRPDAVWLDFGARLLGIGLGLCVLAALSVLLAVELETMACLIVVGGLILLGLVGRTLWPVAVLGWVPDWSVFWIDPAHQSLGRAAWETVCCGGWMLGCAVLWVRWRRG